MSSLQHQRAFRGRAVGLLSAAAVLLLAGQIPAHQPPKDKDKDETRDEVTFNSADGVELKGFFYKSTKGKNAPVALLMHKYGSDRTKGDWDKLAKALQAKGFAVLTFDFRGHGASTTVNPNFWAQSYNTALISKANAKRTAITQKDFKSGYFPYLVNDIAAARHYIDERNDASDCNAGNIFVIGAQESAALGLLWMAHEWQRPAIPLGAGAAAASVRKAGTDLAGAAWLSAVKAPLGHAFPYLSVPNGIIAHAPEIHDKVPMNFFYGDGDQKGMPDAAFFYGSVLKMNAAATPNSPKPALTFKTGIKQSSLTGIDLYGKAPKADEQLLDYVDKVMDKRGSGNVWTERKPNDQKYEPVPVYYFGFPQQ